MLGRDLDIAYYQRGKPNNHLRPICEPVIDSVDQEHCVAPPTSLDAWRTALFIGALFEAPGIRAIGVDGRAAPEIETALRGLCVAGWISPAACARARLSFETTDTGRGWFYSHHHHLHVSWRADD